MTLAAASKLFALEAGGGIVFGAIIGAIAFWLMRGIADLVAEVLITLAVVMGGYAAAQAMGHLRPVAMAVAGLIMGNQGVKYALSERARDYVVNFWLLIDEILNAVLFLLVGLEAIAVWRENEIMLVALAAVPIVLLARFISVGGPLLLLYRISSLGRGAVPILVWGGLRRRHLDCAGAVDSQGPVSGANFGGDVCRGVLLGAGAGARRSGRLARRYKPDEPEPDAITEGA